MKTEKKSQTKTSLLFLSVVMLAVAVKFGLLIFVSTHCPEKILMHDSFEYLQGGQTIFNFLSGADTHLRHGIFRTPGYPFLLSLLHYSAGISLFGISILQITLNFVTAWVTAKSAKMINPKLENLAFLIILVNVPLTIFSVMILTESIFVFLLSVFLYCYIKYIREQKLSQLIWIILTLTAATYVRPITYYLPVAVAGSLLLIHHKNLAKKLLHILLIFVVSYGLIFAWQYRNYEFAGKFKFSSIDNATIKKHGIVGIIKGEVDLEGHSPVVEIVKRASVGLIHLMTEPASLKYFENKPLKRIGVVLGYLVIIFWLLGFLIGIVRMRKIREFWFLLMVIGYFLAITLAAVGIEVTPRFRIPMMPFIAVISAYGWLSLKKPSNS